MASYNKSYGRPNDRYNERRESLGLPRDDDLGVTSERDSRRDRDFRDRNTRSARSRSLEQSLDSSSNGFSCVPPPELNIMKFIEEWTTLLMDSAVERFDEKNLEKAYERTNADYRRSVEKHSEFPSLVQLQRHTNEDALRNLTAIKKRRAHADSLLLNKAKNLCELIGIWPLVGAQAGTRDDTHEDSDATEKKLAAVRQKQVATCRDLENKYAGLQNTMRQHLDNTKQRLAFIQKEIEQLRREVRETVVNTSGLTCGQLRELKSSYEVQLEGQKQLYETKLAQEKSTLKQYIDDAFEKWRRYDSTMGTGDFRNQQSAESELIRGVSEQMKKKQDLFPHKGQAAEHHALRQQVLAQEKQIEELIQGQLRLAELEEKVKGLEAQQKAHSKSILTQSGAVRGEIHELQQESRETSRLAELVAVRADLSELQRKTEERDEALSTPVNNLSKSVFTGQPVANPDLADIDGLGRRIGAVEHKVGNTDISGLDLKALDSLVEWYSTDWPRKKEEMAALNATIKKLDSGARLPPEVWVGHAEPWAQEAASLRAELNKAVANMNDGLKKTINLCRDVVKSGSGRVGEVKQVPDAANSTTWQESRAEMYSWKASMEKQHQDFVERVQKVEDELRGSIDLCRFSIEALDSQFNGLSTKNLAKLILSHLEQLQPNRPQLDADHQWLRNKIEVLENDLQGVKRQLEDIHFTKDHANALSHEHANDGMTTNPAKKRRLSVATNGGA